MILYKTFELRYLDQVLTLLEPLWGHLSLQEQRAYFEWKYINNPNLNIPPAYIAVETIDDTVVGFRGYFILKYFKNNKSFFIASGSDAIILKNYRGKGFFEKLTLYSIKDIEKLDKIACINSITNNNSSLKTYYKIKSQKLSERKTLYRITNLFNINKKHLYTIESSKSVLFEEIETLASSCLSKNKFSVSYDGKQLNWRYSNPTTDYHFIYIKDKHKQLVTYISYYKIDAKKVHIIDYMYKTIDQLKIGLIGLKKKEKALLTLIEVFSSEEELLFLNQLNFKKLVLLKKLFKKSLSNDVVIRPVSLNFKEKDWIIHDTDIRDNSNWQLNLLCSDGI